MKTKTHLTILLVFSFVILTIEKSLASIAYPYPVNVTQNDRTVINVIMQGDEHLKWAQSMDGYTLVYNNNGIFEYGKLDDAGDLVPSGIKAHNISKRSLTELSFLSTVAKGLGYSTSQVSIIKQLQLARFIDPTSILAFPTTGNRKLICILIGYTDLAFSKTNTDFQNLFNQVAYSADGAAGSVKDYFLENSYNQLNLTVDVAGPYTVSDTRAHYGANNASGNDVLPREMVTEAVNLADPDVNFADYDNDGDGTVDGVYVIYAGHGEEAGGGANAIWAHAWSIPTVTLDGKDISRYSTSSELRGSSGSGISRIGVICHEFGHVLGEKDFYDTDYATGGQYNGNGNWDVMASGNWNNDGITPAHANPYTKAYTYNWVTVTTLSSQGTVTLQSSHNNSTSFYRFNTTTANEYYIMENIQQVGFNASVPGHGLLIYHAHADLASHIGPNDINATGPQYFYPVCASASSEPGLTPASYGSNNSGGATYPGTSSKTEFTDATTPSQKSWAGANTAKPLAFITEDNAARTVTFCYLGCPPVADFSANNKSPCTGETVPFTDLSTYAPTSWLWTFTPNTVTFTGGTSSSSQNPQVMFNASGAYTVELKATNAYGNDTETKNNYITVTAKPTVTLQPSNQVKQWGDNASFTSTAIGPPAPTVQWQVSTDDGGIWNNIVGETNTTLNLTCVTLTQNGYKYRAVFTNVCGSTSSDPATLTVTPRTTTSTVTVSPNPQQYSDTVTFNILLTNAVACSQQAATGVRIYVGTQLMGAVTLSVVGTNLVATLAAVPLLEPTPFGTAPTGQMAPGPHTVTAEFTGVNSNFSVSDPTTVLNITKEDARAYYTGASFGSTFGVNNCNAIITLSATFKDITAVTGDPSYDVFAGDIRNATISFVNRDDASVIAANVPLGLVNPADATIAVATYNWNVCITGNSQTFNIGIIINGYYTRNSSEDNTLVTISKPLEDFVTGGGYLVLASSAGIKAGDVSSKNNFGFNVKFNKRGTNLQGNINSIVRKTESDGMHVYQIKGNNFTSLGIQKTSFGGKATINSKASITDITNPLAPVSVEGNGSLQIKFTDRGEPGTNDSIAITIWNKNGGLWFASNWNSTHTIEQVLAGGNLKISSNNSFAREYPSLAEFNSSNSLLIFPNPNNGKFNFSFIASESGNYLLQLSDMLGKVVVIESIIAYQGMNSFDFDNTRFASGIYLLRLQSEAELLQQKFMIENKE